MFRIKKRVSTPRVSTLSKMFFMFVLFSFAAFSRSCYGSYDSHEKQLEDVDYAFTVAESYIRWGDIGALEDVIKKHGAYICEDGQSFLDKLLWLCFFCAKMDVLALVDPIDLRCIGFAANCILAHGANYKAFIDELLDLDDFEASECLKLFIAHGLQDKKIFIKIANHAIKYKKREVLKVIIDAKIAVPRSLRKKIKILLKQRNIAVLHTRVLKELKQLFKKQNKNNRNNNNRKQKKEMTQMEAFLKVWFDIKGPVKNYEKLMGKLLKDEYLSWPVSMDKKDVPLFIKLLKCMNNKEREFKNYYAFYHAHNSTVGFIFDVQTSIVRWLQIEMNLYRDFRMRFETTVDKDIETMDDFLESYSGFFKANWWPDSIEPLRSQLLSVNFAPYANTGIWGECSLAYVACNKSQSSPTRVLYDLFLDLGFNKKYIDKLNLLYNKYMTINSNSGNMLQIFIPKDKVDTFVYLSKAGGWPFESKISGISYDKNKKRHKNISEFLDRYITDPFSLKTNNLGSKTLINRIQGRLVFMPNFYDLQTGIRIFRYNFISKKQRRKYKKEFEAVIDQMMGDWIDTRGYEHLAKDRSVRDAKNNKLVRLLRYIQQGQTGDFAQVAAS